MPPLKRIAILGEIGSGNLGDDLGYVLFREALTRAFADRDILVDLRPLTPNLAHLLGGYHWDAVVTGLGTLLDLARGPYVAMLRSAMEKCPIGIFGTGLSDRAHQVPTDEGRKMFHDLLGGAATVWIRGDTAGADVAGPDIGWLLGDGVWPTDDLPDPPRTLVGLNVGYAAHSRYGVDAVIAMLRGVRPHMRSTQRLVAAWENDVRFCTDLDANAPIHHVTGTRASLFALLEYKTLFCTRVHLAVFAACMGVRTVMLDYSTKVDDVCWGVPEILRPVVLRGGKGATGDLLTTDESWRYVAEALEAPAIPDEAARQAARALGATCTTRVEAGVERLCAKAGW